MIKMWLIASLTLTPQFQLYDRYLQKCSDNMRLTTELRSAKPDVEEDEVIGLARFNGTVEPVILEYEKIVSALNTQLDQLRNELVSLLCGGGGRLTASSIC
jgi:hypothetical protein